MFEVGEDLSFEKEKKRVVGEDLHFKKDVSTFNLCLLKKLERLVFIHFV